MNQAGLVKWKDATIMRVSAVKHMRVMRDNRKTIMFNYLKSIGLDNAGWKRYYKLIEKVDELRGSAKLTLSPYLLK